MYCMYISPGFSIHGYVDYFRTCLDQLCSIEIALDCNKYPIAINQYDSSLALWQDHKKLSTTTWQPCPTIHPILAETF